MVPLVKIFAIVVLAVLWPANGSCGDGMGSCTQSQEQQDETSMLQVMQAVKPGSERPEETPESAVHRRSTKHVLASPHANEISRASPRDYDTIDPAEGGYPREIPEQMIAHEEIPEVYSEYNIGEDSKGVVKDPELMEGTDKATVETKSKNPYDAEALNQHRQSNAQWAEYHAQKQAAEHEYAANKHFTDQTAYAEQQARRDDAIAASGNIAEEGADDSIADNEDAERIEVAGDAPEIEDYEPGHDNVIYHMHNHPYPLPAAGAYVPAYGPYGAAPVYGPAPGSFTPPGAYGPAPGSFVPGAYGPAPGSFVPGGYNTPEWAEKSSEAESCWDLCKKADVHKELCHYMCKNKKAHSSKASADAENSKEEGVELYGKAKTRRMHSRRGTVAEEDAVESLKAPQEDKVVELDETPEKPTKKKTTKKEEPLKKMPDSVFYPFLTEASIGHKEDSHKSKKVKGEVAKASKAKGVKDLP